MCGIYGFTGPPAPALAAAMAGLLRHRGPDGAGRLEGPALTLGATRLAIQGVANGEQPLTSESGEIHLVCNGEIYNAPDLRRALERRGHRFATDSDCEPIVHLYEEEGDGLLARIDGMFAFALWDAPRRRLLLARDRMGMKPLFYTQPAASGRLLFASEIKALLAAPEVERRLDPDALDECVRSAYVGGSRTLFADVRQLLPGHRLLRQADSTAVAPYWRLGPAGGPRAAAPPDPVARFRRLFESAVASHLASEAPLGFALSGGIDSSYVVAVAARLAGRGLRAYSIGARQLGDERPWARLLADHVGAEHREIEISGDELLAHLPHALWHLEMPRAGPILTNDLFFERVAREVRVVLTGEGADELLGGYDRLKTALPPLGWLPAGLGRRAYESATALLPSRAALYQPGFLARLASSPSDGDGRLAAVFRSAGAERLAGLLDYEVRDRLPPTHLTRLDRLGMAHSVEVRLPFLDRAVVEFVHALPGAWKAAWRGEKRLLREAARGILPEAIRTRRKHGQREPKALWLRHGLLALAVEYLNEAALQRRGYFRQRYLQSLRRRVARGRRRPFDFITLDRFVQIEAWHRLYLDPERLAPPPARPARTPLA